MHIGKHLHNQANENTFFLSKSDILDYLESANERCVSVWRKIYSIQFNLLIIISLGIFVFASENEEPLIAENKDGFIY